MNMADCPIFAPAAPKMPADRLGLRGTVKREYDQSSAERMTRNVDGEFNRLTTYYGCATITFASLADSASIAYNIPVHGPLFGTHYSVRVFVNLDLDGLSMSGYVSANDRVTVVFQNDTGAAVQPASSFEVCVIVERYPIGQNSLIGSDVAGTVTGGTAGGDTVITPPIGFGNLVLTGYAPTVVALNGNVAVTPDTGGLILTGYAPTVSKTDNVTIAAGSGITKGSLVLTGYSPTVTNSGIGSGVQFDGSTVIGRAGLSGVSDSSAGTGIFYIKFTGADTSTQYIFSNEDDICNRPIAITRPSSPGHLDFSSLACTMRSTNNYTTADGWIEVMWSFQGGAGEGSMYLYVDDVDDLNTSLSETNNFILNWGTSTKNSIGGKYAGTFLAVACMKGFALWPGVLLDLSVSSNRTNLRNYDIGSSPAIYQDVNNGPPDDFLVNQGTGGDFTETTGALVICSDSP